MGTAITKSPNVLVALGVVFLAAGCGSADSDARSSITQSPPITDVDNTSVAAVAVGETSGESSGESSGDPTVESSGDPTNEPESATAGDDVVSQIVELAGSDAFASDNSDASIATAVAAFNDAGLDFSADGLAGSLAPSCSSLDTQAVSEIIGVDVRVEDFDGFLSASSGYLSCGLYTANPPDVALAYVHLAPDLNGSPNWGSIGTLEGAFDIPGLGDVAVWSDGSRSDNMTNPLMRQIQVEQGGTQSLIQAEANRPQLELVGMWSIPKLMLVLAVANASLS